MQVVEVEVEVVGVLAGGRGGATTVSLAGGRATIGRSSSALLSSGSVAAVAAGTTNRRPIGIVIGRDEATGAGRSSGSRATAGDMSLGTATSATPGPHSVPRATGGGASGSGARVGVPQFGQRWGAASPSCRTYAHLRQASIGEGRG